MQTRFVVTCLFVYFALCASYPTQLNYNVGDELQYSLHATLDARGNIASNNQRTSGSFSTMDSILVTQCVQQNSDSYIFVMNMFDTTVNVGQGSQLGQSLGDEPLGDDMYYEQKFSGEIPQIWYQEGDDPYFVNVKIGAINAFQTHIVAPSDSEVKLESDPVGTHYSKFFGSAGQLLTVNKSFTEADFTSFPDPNLQKNNVQITALTSTGIHNNGYIVNSAVNQLVNLVQVGPGGSSSSSHINKNKNKNVGDGDTRAVDMTMSSAGSLAITLQTTGKASRLRNSLSVSQLQSNPKYISQSLTGAASHMMRKMHHAKKNSLNLLDTLNKIVTTTDKAQALKMMNQVIRRLNQESSDIAVLSAFLAHYTESNAVARDRLFYILSGVEDSGAAELLMEHGLRSETEEVQMRAIFSASRMTRPSHKLIAKIREWAFSDLSHVSNTVQRTAVLAFGSMLKNAHGHTMCQKGGDALLTRLAEWSVDKEKTWSDLVSVIDAIGNAGPKCVDISKFAGINGLSSHPHSSVRASFAFALRKFVEIPAAQSVLLTMTRKESSVEVLNAIGSVWNRAMKYRTNDAIFGSDFPFNQSFSKDIKLGGSEVNVDFQGELFAGTNFDCNQPQFNYEALAQATATLTFFDYTKQAFTAQAVYGKDNGQPLADRIFLQVWDDVIYDQQIPSVDCSVHTYPLGHTSPGFTFTYTLWVSVIPVIFSASANLDLDLQWGWQICDTQLSAMVELIPTATLSLDGKAEIDLLIIKAGLELSGSFNTQLIPQGYIHGSECAVGFDVNRVSQPMSISLDSYYETEKCKFLIFDCHWGQRNQQTWFSWSLPSVNQVIFDQEWKIQP